MVKERWFFEFKKPWSKIKDDILKYYLTAYLPKVAKLRKRIILIDAFAGPGKYNDNEVGSPLIIYDKAEKWVKGRYTAIFMNKNEKHYKKLSDTVSNYKNENVLSIRGDSEILLKNISEILTDQTIFVYLDPFGIKECKYDTIRPFLERKKQYSTEILMKIDMPVIHRLGVDPKSKARPLTEKEQMWHNRLTLLFNGDYWKNILWTTLKTEEKEYKLITTYLEHIKTHLPFTGFCPVRAKPNQRIKYFLIFCSRHEDALVIMNDAMCTAYEKAMYHAILPAQNSSQTTLFEREDWKEIHRRKVHQELENVIQECIKQKPGLTRYEYQVEVVRRNFMHFLGSEYLDKIKELTEKGIIVSPTRRPTKRLNDRCKLFLRGDYANN